jgi:hypothetical protein
MKINQNRFINYGNIRYVHHDLIGVHDIVFLWQIIEFANGAH